MNYAIHTARETYSVDGIGNIGRPAIGMAPSGQWRVLGAARYNNFGRQVAFLPFPQCMAITDWRNKNGTPRWRLRDLDHGTMREWGNAVLCTVAT